MKPVSRYGVNKRHSAGQFRGNVGRTRRLNIQPVPMRGGWRL